MTKKLKLSVYWVARSIGLFRLFRTLTRSKLRIICYHGGRLGDENQYNPKLFCSAAILESRLHWLLDNGFSIMPLDAVSSFEPSNRRPNFPTVITFDDGWYSSGRELIPVLAKFGIPSTLYLCTRHFVEGWPVPSVTVRYIVWKTLREEVVINGIDAELDAAYDLRDPVSKQNLIEGMTRWLSENGHSRDFVCSALERFAACLGISVSDLMLDSRRFEYMSRDELLNLSSQGCTVEMHGHEHEYPFGSPDRLKEDLKRCQETIRDLGLGPARHYCYPAGSFDSEAPITLRASGVLSATTCIPGLISTVSGDERYFLPRFLDGESISMLEFEAEVSGFTDFVRRYTRRR